MTGQTPIGVGYHPCIKNPALRSLLTKTLQAGPKPLDTGHALDIVYRHARDGWEDHRPDHTWLPIVVALVEDPQGLVDLVAELAGTEPTTAGPRTLLRRRGLHRATFDEVAEQRHHWARLRRHQEMRAWARVENQATQSWNQRQRRARLLRTNASARESLGYRLGGTITDKAARKIQCPDCGQFSVWWWLAPHQATNARCQHQSCGFTAPLSWLELHSAGVVR